ncbi:MAG: hypothetical protein A2V86_12810 [Deltaproteobacteria bacterium RBG_16_49_23]|nr:MAG: hypothetical protein A2V86_12810 [Deltaproteobacteria bacterium RBG_16_49_23]
MTPNPARLKGNASVMRALDQKRVGEIFLQNFAKRSYKVMQTSLLAIWMMILGNEPTQFNG